MLTVDLGVLRPMPGQLVLDAGCGEGRHTFALCRMGCKVFALDRSKTALLRTLYVLKAMERSRYTGISFVVIRGDGLSLPFDEGTFDRIICAEVLEHIPNDSQAIRELVRVLRPGGDMAITVPTCFTERLYGRISWRYFRSPGGHIRIYSPKELCLKLTESGLKIYKVGHAHAFHTIYWLLRCLCGLENEDARAARIYRGFLDLLAGAPILQLWERTCNLFFPKSMVIYTHKPLP